jgi:SAM-dependent methyltransferase
MTESVVRRILMTTVGIGAAYLVFRQCRRPTGWFGRRLATAMNFGHAALTAWGLEHVRIARDWHVLDIGCGGGQTIRTIATAAAAGHVDGVDYSPASVAVARRTNADLIASGRVAIQEATVSRMPFPDAAFDVITAVETHYYWPDLVNDLREARRLLKPHGRLLIVAEAYKGRRMDWLYRPVMQLLLRATYLSVDEHRAALLEGGFVEVEVYTEPSRGWICAVGVRAEY